MYLSVSAVAQCADTLRYNIIIIAQDLLLFIYCAHVHCRAILLFVPGDRQYTAIILDIIIIS